MAQVRVCLASELPSSTTISTKVTPIDGEAVEDGPETGLYEHPREALGVNDDADQGYPHGRCPSIVKFQGYDAPCQIGAGQGDEDLRHHREGWYQNE